MGARMGLHLGLHMGLKLTPQMRMNLELIQSPILEAIESLDQKVVENPWLERDESSADPRLVRESELPTEAVITPREQLDFDEAEAWNDPVASTPYTHEEQPADEGQGIVAVMIPSPYEQLEAQARELDIKRRTQEIALILLQNLDEHGYLPYEENELFEILVESCELDPNRDRAAFDEALTALRYQLEPPGIGARDQSHSFLIQLERYGKGDSLAAKIVRDGVLLAIKPRNLAQVAKKLGIREDELHSALEDLNRLYRHPLSLLDQTSEPTRFPDLIVEKVDGNWVVNLSHPLRGRYRFRDSPVPRKSAVVRESTNGDDPSEVLARLRQMKQDARMLVHATEYRDRTLFEIGRKLVQEQSEFLERGEEALKPLLQKELAESLGMNEATMSRILKEKYIQTPRGVIALKDFFSRSITNKDTGESVSNKVVMDTLQKLLAEEEDPSHPWSDQEISEILKQRGHGISRRTVTKYRLGMGIGAAGDRKAMRRMQEGS
ncbi:MAG: RNA polymerase factor sigma-54 [Candidatus Eisenbacteria bacterium]|nr:RNA polymerase factor sigma-54 [Candidatus Eisenbacteria bacterium]MCC7140862.1 RNA polymerase factor sigma-54 [Candidatus Eisenbacteria bacterium]